MSNGLEACVNGHVYTEASTRLYLQQRPDRPDCTVRICRTCQAVNKVWRGVYREYLVLLQSRGVVLEM